MPERAFNACVEKINAIRDEIKQDSFLERLDVDEVIAVALSGNSIIEILREALTEFNLEHIDVFDQAAEAGLNLGDKLLDGTKQGQEKLQSE